MTVTEPAPTRQNTVLGTRMLRREDPALLTGEAKFTNDLAIPGALHLAVLRSPYAEVDVETGAVEVLRYIAVDDCGNQVNPLIVEGQVHGDVIQGLAQALFEEAVFDSDGNPKITSLGEYLVPAASDVPSITLGHTTTPSPTNQLGVKGIGEAGTIGAAPTVINAIVDALSGLGVTSMAMPASPQTVWSTIQAASSTTSASTSPQIS